MNAAHKKIAGVILSAGESKRMGFPKALLKLGESTLLARQYELLNAAGCDPVMAVVGCKAEEIISAHHLLPVKWVKNELWPKGQFSSVAAGISEALSDDSSGVVLLPIDVIGVGMQTIHAILDAASRMPDIDAIIPTCNGKGGHPVYLSKKFCKNLIGLDLDDEDSRLDVQLSRCEAKFRIETEDAAILKNVNTPKEFSSSKDPSTRS